MSADYVVMVSFVIAAHVAMYITLPLHIRLLYVLIRPSKKIKLDESFQTLMLNTTIGNTLFALVYCFNQAPAGAGVFYDFYKGIGPVMAHIEMIKSSPLITLIAVFHVVLAATRFTAIAFPIKHRKIWLRIHYLCIFLWVVAICISVPLMIPGSVAHYSMTSVFDTPSIQYTFLGNYYQIYSVIGSFFSVGVEVCTILFYIAMISKFNQFRKFTQSNAADVRKMTMGVVRTTMAAVVTSMGSWIIVVFIVIIFSYMYSTGTPLLDNLHFSSIFVLLNSINNVLTPWVLLFAFPNVRTMLFFNIVSWKDPASERSMSERKSERRTKSVVHPVSGSKPVTLY